jgi:hypothetical protein
VNLSIRVDARHDPRRMMLCEAKDVELEVFKVGDLAGAEMHV